MAIPGAGHVHSELQRELLAEMQLYRVIESKVTEEDMAHIYRKIDSVLSCPDVESLTKAKEALRRSINSFVSGLWSQKKAKGPESPERLLKEAKSKESFAKWRKDLGGDANMDRAAKALAEAEMLRKRADELQNSKQQSSTPVYRVVPTQALVPLAPRADGKRRRMLIVDVVEETDGT